MNARWMREEFAGIHDRLRYLGTEAGRYRGLDMPGGAGKEIRLWAQRAEKIALETVRYMDREVLERPTVTCPTCGMLAHIESDESDIHWIVCGYCDAVERIERPQEEADEILTTNADAVFAEVEVPNVEVR